MSWMSQSLLHQVTYSDRKSPVERLGAPDMSQSLLHQVTYSDVAGYTRVVQIIGCLNPFYIRSRIPTKTLLHLAKEGNYVSIPFTSGHVFRQERKKHERTQRSGVSIPFTSGHVFRQSKQFSRLPNGKCRLNPFYIRSRIPTMWRENEEIKGRCLNPFYIRSRIPTTGRSRGYMASGKCLNPFYIRSRIPTTKIKPSLDVKVDVSIPFTSGHVFRHSEKPHLRKNVSVSIPFTSGHVFRHPSSLFPSLRFWPSQSLLHQVTYSDKRRNSTG